MLRHYLSWLHGYCIELLAASEDNEILKRSSFHQNILHKNGDHALGRHVVCFKMLNMPFSLLKYLKNLCKLTNARVVWVSSSWDKYYLTFNVNKNELCTQIMKTMNLFTARKTPFSGGSIVFSCVCGPMLFHFCL